MTVRTCVLTAGMSLVALVGSFFLMLAAVGLI